MLKEMQRASVPGRARIIYVFLRVRKTATGSEPMWSDREPRSRDGRLHSQLTSLMNSHSERCYMVIGASMMAASSIRIRLSDPGRASDLRAYFRRHDALAIANDNGTLDVHLLKPFSDRDDERALVRSYLQVWERTGGVPVELLE